MRDFPLSRPLKVADVAAAGTEVAVETDADERAALAAFLGVPAVPALSARLEVRPWRRYGLRVTGRVTGAVEQECVVTLEPVVQEIDEAVDLRFEPARDEEERADPERAREVLVDPLGEDPPEPMSGGTVDLGAIAAEHFALAIDPYPRAPGAVFEAPAGGGEAASGAGDEAAAGGSPFAALARLKRHGDG